MPTTTVQRNIQEFRPTPTTTDRSFQQISPATDPGFKSLLDQILGGIPQPESAPEIQGPEQFLQQLAPLHNLKVNYKEGVVICFPVSQRQL